MHDASQTLSDSQTAFGLLAELPKAIKFCAWEESFEDLVVKESLGFTWEVHFEIPVRGGAEPKEPCQRARRTCKVTLWTSCKCVCVCKAVI